jgi:hypothetical protein
MRKAAVALALMLSGCGSVQWVRAPEVSEAACTAACDAHYGQCPQVFAGFPERGAVECPAEHNNCLKACGNGHTPAQPAAPALLTAPPAQPVAPALVTAPPAQPGAPATADPAPSAASSLHTAASKETRLRELKRFHDEGLVSEDVYRERQKAILAEP